MGEHNGDDNYKNDDDDDDDDDNDDDDADFAFRMWLTGGLMTPP